MSRIGEDIHLANNQNLRAKWRKISYAATPEKARKAQYTTEPLADLLGLLGTQYFDNNTSGKCVIVNGFHSDTFSDTDTHKEIMYSLSLSNSMSTSCAVRLI